MAGIPVVFAAGASGVWRIERQIAIRGQGLPAIARRPYHSRDLGEPFDWLTWFESCFKWDSWLETGLGKVAGYFAM